MRYESRRRSWFCFRFQSLKGVRPAGPQHPQAFVDQGGGEAPPHQERPQAAQTSRGRVAAPLSPVAARQPVDDTGLADLAQALSDALLYCRTRDAPSPKPLPDTLPALAAALHAAARVTGGQGGVVEVPLAPQAVQGGLGGVLGVSLAEKGLAKLFGGDIAPGHEGQRRAPGALLGVPALLGGRRGPS